MCPHSPDWNPRSEGSAANHADALDDGHREDSVLVLAADADIAEGIRREAPDVVGGPIELGRWSWDCRGELFAVIPSTWPETLYSDHGRVVKEMAWIAHLADGRVPKEVAAPDHSVARRFSPIVCPADGVPRRLNLKCGQRNLCPVS